MDKKVIIIAVGVNVFVLIHQYRKVEQIRERLSNLTDVVIKYADPDSQYNVDVTFEDIVEDYDD